MSDKYICSESKLTGIGDAIRAKTGDSEKLTLDGMASAIEGISTGSDVQQGIYTSDGTKLYLDTDIDYQEGIEVVFFALSNFTNAVESRYLINGLKTNEINHNSMGYIKATSSTETRYYNYYYIVHYLNQLSIENNDGKIRIKTTTYNFAAADFLVTTSKKLNVTSGTGVSEYPGARITTNIPYSYGKNYIIIIKNDVSDKTYSDGFSGGDELVSAIVNNEYPNIVRTANFKVNDIIYLGLSEKSIYQKYPTYFPYTNVTNKDGLASLYINESYLSESEFYVIYY